MRRFELYSNNEGRLTLAIFKDENDLYESKIIHGVDTYEPIRHLANYKVNSITVNYKTKELTIKCDDCIINIGDADDTLYRRGMAPILRNVKEYEEKQKLREVINQKVVRKNKYSKTRIIAGGLALIMLTASSIGLIKKNNNSKNDIKDESIEEFVDNENNIEDNFVVEQSTKEFTNMQNNDIEYEPKIETISICYLDRSDTDKAYITKAYYSELIENNAKKYGLDKNLILAIATQERGIHSNSKDVGGATGLMQIQNAVWVNETVTAFNFETNKEETQKITSDNICDVYSNVKIGCMIYQNCLKYMNYNTIAATQCYNMGYGNMMKILTAYAKDNNKTVEDVLNNKTDIGWLDYRNLVNQGDQNYVENVCSWIGDEIVLTNYTSDNQEILLKVNNEIDKKIYK